MAIKVAELEATLRLDTSEFDTTMARVRGQLSSLGGGASPAGGSDLLPAAALATGVLSAGPAASAALANTTSLTSPGISAIGTAWNRSPQIGNIMQARLASMAAQEPSNLMGIGTMTPVSTGGGGYSLLCSRLNEGRFSRAAINVAGSSGGSARTEERLVRALDENTRAITGGRMFGGITSGQMLRFASRAPAAFIGGLYLGNRIAGSSPLTQVPYVEDPRTVTQMLVESWTGQPEGGAIDDAMGYRRGMGRLGSRMEDRHTLLSSRNPSMEGWRRLDNEIRAKQMSLDEMRKQLNRDINAQTETRRYINNSVFAHVVGVRGLVNWWTTGQTARARKEFEEESEKMGLPGLLAKREKFVEEMQTTYERGMRSGRTTVSSSEQAWQAIQGTIGDPAVRELIQIGETLKQIRDQAAGKSNQAPPQPLR